MKIAVTGTPGVGKTSACSLVRGLRLVRVNELVDEVGAAVGYDRGRKTKEVDVGKLAKAVAKMEGDVLIEGHLSHFLGPDIAVVLRCSPTMLERRLRKKRWDERKVRENVEAEAVDVVLIEALENVPLVCEVDTTDMPVRAVARAIEEIIAGEREKYSAGHVDWSQEVLDWF